MNKNKWIDAEIIDLGVKSTESDPNTNYTHDGVLVGYLANGTPVEGHS